MIPLFWLGSCLPLWGQVDPQQIETVSISDSLTPEVRYGIERMEGGVLVVIQVEGFQPGGRDVAVRVGMAADRPLVYRSDQVLGLPGDSERDVLFAFSFPEREIMAGPQGYDKLRMAFEVVWTDPILGQMRLKQRFRNLNPASAHAGLSPNPMNWKRIDLNEWERESLDRALTIAFEFEQPMAGVATIVIEDENGERVRNLVSGQSMEQGKHRIEWDGLDEGGVLVEPGNYAWRSISHPGLVPTHQMSFADAPGSNHGTFHAATHNGESIILGTQNSEGGYEVVALEKDGTLIHGFNAPHGHGLGRVQVAADDRYIYAAYDGTGWGTHVDRSKPDWKAPRSVTLVRFEIESGRTAEYPGKGRLPKFVEYEFGPGSEGGLGDVLALSGLAYYEGKLFMADAVHGRILVIDPETADVERTFPIEDPVALAASGGSLYALGEPNRLLKIEALTGEVREIAQVSGEPKGLAVDGAGRFYVSDQESDVIRILNERGEETGTIGHPGGIRFGYYDPLRFHEPEGITVLDGELWVTERTRWLPKRYAAFDVETGELIREFFGPTAYGAPGGGFDREDPTQWIGMQTHFELDFEKKTARAQAILGAVDRESMLSGYRGRRNVIIRQDGRTFVLTMGKILLIQEWTESGNLKPLAFFSSAHQFCFAHQWDPPEVFIEAFQRDFPDARLFSGEGDARRVLPDHGYGGMLWTDRNGDG
ncbi:MAG: FlgD immunoglobulin-like domain containing protein, partial [Puniceicoccales bacterium]